LRVQRQYRRERSVRLGEIRASCGDVIAHYHIHAFLARHCCSKNSTLSPVVKIQEGIICNRLIAFTASLKASRKSGKRSRSAPIESSPISGFSTAEIATMIAAGSRSVTDLIPKALTSYGPQPEALFATGLSLARPPRNKEEYLANPDSSLARSSLLPLNPKHKRRTIQ